jgi:hypothetical protein
MIDRKLKSSWHFIKMAERTTKNDWVARGRGHMRSVGSIGPALARSGCGLDHAAWGQRGVSQLRPSQARLGRGRGVGIGRAGRQTRGSVASSVAWSRWCIAFISLSLYIQTLFITSDDYPKKWLTKMSIYFDRILPIYFGLEWLTKIM